MAEKGRSEVSPQKRSLKLNPILGDWTTYKPPRTLVKKVKIGLYGFDRLSEEELKQTHLLHYKFAEQFCDLLRKKFHVGSELYQVEALQNTYINFIKNFTTPIYQGKVNCSNFHDEIFMAFDMQLVNSLINASLGSFDLSRFSEELSKADEMILGAFIEEYLGIYYQIFKGNFQNPIYEKVGSPNISENNSINPQSTFVHFIIELSINNSICKIIIGYNGIFLKNLLKKLNQAEKLAPLLLAKLPNSIFNLVNQPITVTLGNTTLTMSEIRGLEVGDVVSFDRNIDSAIPISLNEGHTILGQPGKSNEHLAVKVVAVEKEKSVKVAPPIFAEYDKESDESNLETQTAEDEQPVPEFDKIEEEFPKEANLEDQSMSEFTDEDMSEEDLEGSLEDELEDETEEEKEGPAF